MLIETSRLYLRPLENTDIENFFTYIVDEHLCRMAGLETISDKPTAEKVLADFIRDGVCAIVYSRLSNGRKRLGKFFRLKI